MRVYSPRAASASRVMQMSDNNTLQNLNVDLPVVVRALQRLELPRVLLGERVVALVVRARELVELAAEQAVDLVALRELLGGAGLGGAAELDAAEGGGALDDGLLGTEPVGLAEGEEAARGALEHARRAVALVPAYSGWCALPETTMTSTRSRRLPG